MEEALEITEVWQEGIPVLQVSGEIDVATAPQLRARLDDTVGAGRGEVIVDLLNVTFLDSTALGVLVDARNRCHDADGRLHLVSSNPQLRKVFEYAGLTRVFPIHGSVDEVTPGTKR